VDADGRAICHVFWANVSDGIFIAAARTDIPALVAEVRRLRAERDEARQMAVALGFQLQGHMAAEDTSWCPEELEEPPQGWRETIAGWSKELAK
jgi:hypothetical protein